jgi:CheY-like chemotaxis protein
VRAARILVVDDDPWIQRRVASTLGQRGHQVSLAGDGQAALAVASKVRPDLIVTASSLPALDGWPWWRRLRSAQEEAEAATPIIFLHSVLDSTTEIDGLQPRDRSLRKPFRVEDLEQAVVLALGSTPLEPPTNTTHPALPARPPRSVDPTKPTAGFRPLSALRGEVDQVSLASVLTILEMERKTGLLLVERPPTVARLHLRRGRVVRAHTEEPALAGVAAVYDVLGWTAGAFDFLSCDVGGVDEVQTSTTFLLMEGARRADEARRRAEAEARRAPDPEHGKL